VRIQNADASQRYQTGRTVGPVVATLAVSGCARNSSTSKLIGSSSMLKSG